MRKRKALPRITQMELDNLKCSLNNAEIDLEAARNKILDLEAMAEARGQTINSMGNSVQILRNELEDMRKERDGARRAVEMHQRDLAKARLQLQRAMGWIDCKNGQPPEIEGPQMYGGEVASMVERFR